MKTLRELLLEPECAAAFPPDRLIELEQALQADRDHDMPWYLRFVIGLGAWLASLFFLGSACTLLGWDQPNRTSIGVMGIVLLIIAVLVGRQKWGVFAEQAALAVSLAAQGMIYVSVLDDEPAGHPLRTAMLVALALAAILYFAYPAFLSRLMTCFAALQLTLVWIGFGDPIAAGSVREPATVALLSLAWWAVHLGGIVFTLLPPQRAIDLKPLGYALVASLAAWQIENLLGAWSRVDALSYSSAEIMWFTYNLRGSLLGLAFLVIAAWAAGGRDAVRAHLGPCLGLAAAVVALVYLGLGGVLLALLFVLLGFALQDWPILGLGLLLFPAFLAHYYYSLQLDLLQKSGVLVTSGIVVLLLRAGIRHVLKASSAAKEIS